MSIPKKEGALFYLGFVRFFSSWARGRVLGGRGFIMEGRSQFSGFWVVFG